MSRAVEISNICSATVAVAVVPTERVAGVEAAAQAVQRTLIVTMPDLNPLKDTPTPKSGGSDAAEHHHWP